jgi:GNAT superfamily N-acetyltransferase
MTDPVRIERRKSLPVELQADFPRLARRYLSDPDALIFVASVADQDVGYVVASVEPATRSGEVEAISVNAPYRQQGIATQLLTRLEAELIERQCLVVTILYEAADPSITALEHLLSRRTWWAPQLFIQRYHFDVQAFHPPWFEKAYPLPPEFCLFPWKEFTEADRQLIERQLKGGTFSANVYPFGDDRILMEPLNSLGLRHRDKLIGWMVTHRMSPDTIRYAYFYVQDDYRHQGYSIRLLTDAIRLQQASPVPKSTFEIREARIDKRWQRFIQRRLAPYAESTSQLLMRWKDLRS